MPTTCRSPALPIRTCSSRDPEAEGSSGANKGGASCNGGQLREWGGPEQEERKEKQECGKCPLRSNREASGLSQIQLFGRSGRAPQGEKEGEEKEKEATRLQWFLIHIFKVQLIFQGSGSTSPEKVRKETWERAQVADGPCSFGSFRHVPRGRKGQPWSGGSEFTSSGAELFSNLGEATVAQQTKGRKGVVFVGVGFGQPQRGESRRLPGGPVPCSGDPLWKATGTPPNGWKMLEVSRLEEGGAAPPSLLLAARRHQRTIDRASGRGSFGRSDGGWSSGSYGAGSWNDSGLG